MRPRALDVILLGGAAVALLDIANAIAFWHFYADAPPHRILQAVAAGLLGKESFTGGAATAWLGLALHFLIAYGMAAVYWLACLRWPALLGRPVAAGLGYGIVSWAAMNHVVVPLSRALPPPFILAWFVDGILAHLFLVGLLLAFVARWSARRQAR